MFVKFLFTLDELVSTVAVCPLGAPEKVVPEIVQFATVPPAIVKAVSYTHLTLPTKA